jgi:hypothetical protein
MVSIPDWESSSSLMPLRTTPKSSITTARMVSTPGLSRGVRARHQGHPRLAVRGQGRRLRTASAANQSPIAAEAATMIHCSAAPAANAIPAKPSARSRKRTPRAWRCVGAATRGMLRGSRVREAPHGSPTPGEAAIHWIRTEGRSSVGRAAVSKTVGRGFESLRPCS